LSVYLFRKSSPASTGRAFDPAVRLASFGIVWFFVTLSVESSLIPIVDVIFEHRVYLPSVGFFVAVSTAGALISRSADPARPTRILVVAGALLALALSVATFQRNKVWADELSLWSDATRKSPYKSRPHTNLGFALMTRGQMEPAIEHYLTALKIDPSNTEAHNNLGIAYSRIGKVEQAFAHLSRSIQLRPDYAEARSNLGAVLVEKGEVDPAITHYLTAIQIRPNYAEARNNLGVAYFKKGMVDEAIDQFRIAIALKSDYAEAHNNLGIAYGRKGWTQPAAEEISLGMKLQSGR
jgi:Flp pilus assembly protein TadD